MFTLQTPEQPYHDPWLLPLDARIAMLAASQQRVAYYYEAPNNSTFRYRAYNMAQVLNADPQGGVSASWFHQEDFHRLDEIAAVADRLVICRSGYDHRVAAMIARFRSQGRPVLFDVDDFVFDTDYTHLLIDTLALDKNDPRVWDDWFAMMGRMGRTLRCCDGAITTNSFLAQRIAKFTGKPVAVVPNFMNVEQLRMSEAVFAEKQARRWRGDGPLCVGYFSGSPSHRLDFEIIESALADWLDEDASRSLMLVGYIEPGRVLQAHGAQIVRAPFHDYVNLQRLVGSVDLNLVPLQSNDFTDCKSELKYFEAAAVGTLSLASPQRNYAAAIRHGDNGWLSRAHEWLLNLRRALGQPPENYESMAQRARGHVLEHYAWTGQRPAILHALQVSSSR
jgi:glycosyltransferase involved in cell wall biosynthesis